MICQRSSSTVAVLLYLFCHIIECCSSTGDKDRSSILSGAKDSQEQKILDTQELLELCTRTEERFPRYTRFEFSQIVDATANFSENRKVGWGGFATIYKVIITQNRMN
jgi:hypothetical protein